jgi:hypothetical protein
VLGTLAEGDLDACYALAPGLRPCEADIRSLMLL